MIKHYLAAKRISEENNLWRKMGILCQSKTAERYGLKYDRLQWAGEEYLLDEVIDECGDKLKQGEVYSKDELFWIGYIYAYWHFLTAESSKHILVQAPPKIMKRSYAGLHTVDVQLAIEDLKKMASGNK